MSALSDFEDGAGSDSFEITLSRLLESDFSVLVFSFYFLLTEEFCFLKE